MFRKKDAYLTVEASFVMPIVLCLYLMVILAALYLYCRCSISMDHYLLAMRGARFTFASDHYGEVIYGNADEENWSPEAYVAERMKKAEYFYPYFQVAEGCFLLNDELAEVQSKGKGSKNSIEKTFKIKNPIRLIREGRRN